jgi:hypothetical protein
MNFVSGYASLANFLSRLPNIIVLHYTSLDRVQMQLTNHYLNQYVMFYISRCMKRYLCSVSTVLSWIIIEPMELER